MNHLSVFSEYNPSCSEAVKESSFSTVHEIVLEVLAVMSCFILQTSSEDEGN